MPRAKPPSPEEHAEAQSFGNVDPRLIREEDRLERQLQSALEVALANVRAIATNPKSTAAAKVAAFKALNEQTAKLREERATRPVPPPGTPLGRGATVEELAQLLRQFGEPVAREAMKRAFQKSRYAQAPVDLAELGTL